LALSAVVFHNCINNELFIKVLCFYNYWSHVSLDDWICWKPEYEHGYCGNKSITHLVNFSALSNEGEGLLLVDQLSLLPVELGLPKLY
jgi:hypothetical protein